MTEATTALYAVCCFLKYRSKCRRGFLLAEMQFSLAVSALLAVLAGSSMMYIFDACRKVQADIQLQECGRYMFAALEKDVGAESTLIVLEQGRGGTVINCRTRMGRKSFRFHREAQALYKSTTTGSGTGKNPLYLPDCAVIGWQVQKINEKMLLITLILEKEARRRTFQRLIYCVNGHIENGA